MDYEPSTPDTKHSEDPTTPMIFYPHAPPSPREPTPSSPSSPQPLLPNPGGAPSSSATSSPLRVVSPVPLSRTYPASTIFAGSDVQSNDSELCTHRSNTLPVYCFDCDLIHTPGECDGVFGLSKRSGLWVWFGMKWIRSTVGVKRGRVAGEDSAFVQIVGAREVGYRWVGGGERDRRAMRMR